MASGAETAAPAARFLLPDLIERGRANVLSCPVYVAGALVLPSAGTVTITDGVDVIRLDEEPVTYVGNVATTTWSPASTLELGEGWRVEWALTVGGVPYVFLNDAALVRRRLSPVVTPQDLYRRVRGLDPSSPAPISTLTAADIAETIAEAFAELQGRLIGRGNRPNLIMSPSALRPVHIALSLALLFEDFESRLAASWGPKAVAQRKQVEDLWGGLNFLYDADDSGKSDDKRRRPIEPSTWLCGR